MKKYSIIVLCSCLLVGIVCSVLLKKKEPELTLSTSSFVYEWQEQQIQENLHFPSSWLTEYEVYSSLSELDSECIFYFHIDANKRESIKDKMHEYRKSYLKKHDKVMWKEYEKEDVYIMVISKNANTIMKQLKERNM